MKTQTPRFPSTLRRPAFVLAVSLLFTLCIYAAEEAKKGEAPAPAKEAGEKKGEPESRVKRGPNGEILLTLDEETQKLMGLQTAEIAPAQLKPELKGYGRVLDPAALAAVAADVETSQAAGKASELELQRLKLLAAEGNTSARALQAGEAAAAHDRAQLQAARLRLVAGWGDAIAGREDLEAFVQSLGSRSNALVELDVPAGQAVAAVPTGARLFTLAEATNPVPAQLLGAAPMVDQQFQGRGFLFLVSPNSGRFTPGAAVSGSIELPGKARTGLALPQKAVVQFNGKNWCYLQTDATTFQRVEVALDSPLGGGNWFVREGLKPQSKVVVVGAPQMLSEELKGQGAD